MAQSVMWNPWHGCTKTSEGCANCYVYRQDKMYGSSVETNFCRRTLSFDMPIKKKRNGEYKYESGTTFYTCFESDFLLEDADKWRDECYKMMKEREDCIFIFFTKRINRLENNLPKDWNDGYDNVIIGCTTENQKRADERLPIFNSLKIKHKMIIVEPMLEEIDLTKYLNESIMEVTAGGESGKNARELDFDWISKLQKDCILYNVPFSFHQTGNHFRMNGILYNIERKYQHSQAKKAGVDFGIKKQIKLKTKSNKTDGQIQFNLDL